MIYKEIYTIEKLVDAHEQQKGISWANEEGAGRKELWAIYY